MNYDKFWYPLVVELLTAIEERTTAWASEGMLDSFEKFTEASFSPKLRTTRYPGAPFRILTKTKTKTFKSWFFQE